MEKPVKKAAARKPRSTTTASPEPAPAKPRAAAGTKTPAARTTKKPIGLDHDAIAAHAYDLFQRSGHPHGRDVEFWLTAERDLKTRLKT